MSKTAELRAALLAHDAWHQRNKWCDFRWPDGSKDSMEISEGYVESSLYEQTQEALSGVGPVEVAVWELMVALVYRTPDGLREESVRCLCTAEDLIDAVHSAKRFGERLVRNGLYGDEECGTIIGCIKVHPKVIGRVGEKGESSDRLGFNSFEWKYDWPGSFEDYVSMKERDVKRRIG